MAWMQWHCMVGVLEVIAGKPSQMPFQKYASLNLTRHQPQRVRHDTVCLVTWTRFVNEAKLNVVKFFILNESWLACKCADNRGHHPQLSSWSVIQVEQSCLESGPYLNSIKSSRIVELEAWVVSYWYSFVLGHELVCLSLMSTIGKHRPTHLWAPNRSHHWANSVPSNLNSLTVFTHRVAMWFLQWSGMIVNSVQIW